LIIIPKYGIIKYIYVNIIVKVCILNFKIN